MRPVGQGNPETAQAESSALGTGRAPGAWVEGVCEPMPAAPAGEGGLPRQMKV